MTTIPAIVLVRPQMPENIGAVARAMSNFGLTDLRLVAPREGWPQARAREVASGGEAVIDAAKAFRDTASALADIHIAYATTARARDIDKKVITPEEAMGEMVASQPDARCQKTDVRKEASLTSDIRYPASGVHTALVFGPERTGLENDDLALCDAFISIPTAPGHYSLNLAQAVTVLGYEWFRQMSDAGCQMSKENPILDIQHPASDIGLQSSLAQKADWQGLFGQMEAYLEEANYFRVAHKKPIMWQNLQNMLLRARLSEQEIRTLRGVFRAIYETRAMRAGRKKQEV